MDSTKHLGRHNHLYANRFRDQPKMEHLQTYFEASKIFMPKADKWKLQDDLSHEDAKTMNNIGMANQIQECFKRLLIHYIQERFIPREQDLFNIQKVSLPREAKQQQQTVEQLTHHINKNKS